MQDALDVGHRTSWELMVMLVSVVIPCLNEARTLARCIEKAKRAVKEMKVQEEIIVADNGSTDGSIKIAESLGARVVHQPERGYGNACRAGIEAARGRYIVMGDADDTYDFREIPKFVRKLDEEYDLVLGSRLRGEILPGAMSLTHKVGNLFLTGVLNLLFKAGVSDAHCGMRAFRRDAYERMGLRSEGMEFASEMVIAAVERGMRIGEVPIRYYPRGEGSSSKLRTVRDGWRHLRFMLGCWAFSVRGPKL
ncbi:glycosyltransferase family 2 protein [Candidatus Poribacteria bacterium]|nr:glycosyltransferase family 2 protein [Candidatus Poribacteria bacterium]